MFMLRIQVIDFSDCTFISQRHSVSDRILEQTHHLQCSAVTNKDNMISNIVSTSSNAGNELLYNVLVNISPGVEVH